MKKLNPADVKKLVKSKLGISILVTVAIIVVGGIVLKTVGGHHSMVEYEI